MIEHEARTPADAYERWVGSQSVSEFLGDDTPEAAVDDYIAEITASPHGGPAEQYGHGPTEHERGLLIEYVAAHTPVTGGDMLGAAEVAQVLGWDRRRVSVYHGRGLLPAPVRELAGTPVWRRQDILRYGVISRLGLTVAEYADLTHRITGVPMEDDGWAEEGVDFAVIRAQQLREFKRLRESRQRILTSLRDTYHLTTDSPMGAQLVAQGMLTEEQGAYLDRVLK